MGNIIKWALPPTEAGWTLTYIESSSDQLTWTALANQAIADNTYYDESGGSATYYRIRFYNGTSLVYSGYSNIIQGSIITTTYCTPEDVQRQLQINDLGGDGRSKPTREDVMEFILEAEEDVNRATGHSWKSETVIDEIYSPEENINDFEIGIPIYLKHRKIRTLTEASGDKIEIWDGSTWTDWVASTSYTEGRNNDYWLDYNKGILWIRHAYLYESGVRLTYRYGETTVPKDIRTVTSLMAAMQILDTNDRTLMVPEGTQFNSYSSRLERMQVKIDEILSNHVEVNII
jgi:hypothetical protein